VVTGFQARKKMPAMNVRRSCCSCQRARGHHPSKPWTQFCDPRIEPSVGERLDVEPRAVWQRADSASHCRSGYVPAYPTRARCRVRSDEAPRSRWRTVSSVTS
jgi:hypothetical protein